MSEITNLTPFFSVPFADTGYWLNTANLTAFNNMTQLGNGWVHIEINTAATGTKMTNYFRVSPDQVALKPAAAYTFLVEIKNVKRIKGQATIRVTNYNTEGIDKFAPGSQLIRITDAWTPQELYKKYINVTSLSEFTGNSYFNNGQIGCYQDTEVSFDMRISFYEGTYTDANPIAYQPCLDSIWCKVEQEHTHHRMYEEWGRFTREVGKAGVDEYGWQVSTRTPTQGNNSHITRTVSASCLYKNNIPQDGSSLTTTEGIWFNPEYLELRPGWNRPGLISYNPSSGILEIKMTLRTLKAINANELGDQNGDGTPLIKTPCVFNNRSSRTILQCCSIIEYNSASTANTNERYHSKKYGLTIYANGRMRPAIDVIPENSLVCIDATLIGAHWGGWFSAYGRPTQSADTLRGFVLSYAQRFMDAGRFNSSNQIKGSWAYEMNHGGGGRCPHISKHTDCSGFVYSAYLYGAKIALCEDVADGLCRLGAVMTKAEPGECLDISGLKPGDVIGFCRTHDEDGVLRYRPYEFFYHVALYLGDNRYVHMTNDYRGCAEDIQGMANRGPFSFDGLNAYKVDTDYRIAVRYILDDVAE